MQLVALQGRGIDLCQGAINLTLSGIYRQCQEFFHGDGHGWFNMQAVRHISHSQAFATLDLAAAVAGQSEHNSGKGGFAGTIGANQGNNLLLVNMQGNVVQNLLLLQLQGYPLGIDQEGCVHEWATGYWAVESSAIEFE